MDVTVTLQENMAYWIWPYIAVGLIVICPIIFLTVRKLIEKKKAGAGTVRKLLSPAEKESLRGEYLGRIDNIYSEYRNGRLSIRKCYQKLSLCVRGFVTAYTGVPVIRCTLSDLKRMNNMVPLAELIENYYQVEFPIQSVGDVDRTVKETKWVIQKWI